MKDQILKLAGVKDEKSFYKKFPTQESFMKEHGKAFKKAAMGASMVKKQLTQLTDFSNPPIAQPGGEFSDNPYGFGSVYGQPQYNPNTSAVGGVNPNAQTAQQAAQGKKSISDYSPYIQAGKDIVEGVAMIDDQKDAVDNAHKYSLLTGVMADAGALREEPIRRRYNRPEDQLINPNQLSPSYGVGTNVLAKYGTEVPSDAMYSDLTYVPLNNPNKMKNFQGGGNMSAFLNDGAFGDVMSQGGGELLGNISQSLSGKKGKMQTAGSKIGGGIGQAAGTFFGGPIGGMVGKAAGNLIGGWIDKSDNKIEAYEDTTEQNVNNLMGSYVGRNIQNKNSAFMKEGGWVSNDWNPQVITKFGDYDVKDLFKPDPTMDTLRMGGNLKQDYVAPSNRALQTYAMGGELQVYEGAAESISENPYLPDGGETVMFRGPSHAEGGMPITYGQSPVEVEGGEPAVKLQNGGEENLVVFGNLKIPNQFLPEIGDPKAKGKKFKNYIADISKIEKRQNTLIDKSSEELDELNVLTPFDKLKFSALEANILGGNMKLKDVADKKQKAALVQSAINDTAEEYGLVADDLAQGKYKKAKHGANIKAQDGKYVSPENYKYLTNLYGEAEKSKSGPAVKKFQEEFTRLVPKIAESITSKYPATNFAKKNKMLASNPLGNIDGIFGERTAQYKAMMDRERLPEIPELIPSSQNFGDMTKPIMGFPKPYSTSAGYEKGPEYQEPFDWKGAGIMAANEILPFLRPSNTSDLDPNQLMGEMYALSQNELEPVQAQTYSPELSSPYDISLQDILNENQSDFNSIQRLAMNNPAALSALAAQKYGANQKVLGEQFRLNQAEKQRVYEGNRNVLNDAELKNLQILDQQYGRQAQAKTNTKAVTQAALNSISSKIAQNKLENKQLATMENLYNYRYDSKGRAINMNPLVDFESMIENAAPADIQKMREMLETKTKKSEKKESRNGSIVRAIKNL